MWWPKLFGLPAAIGAAAVDHVQSQDGHFFVVDLTEDAVITHSVAPFPGMITRKGFA